MLSAFTAQAIVELKQRDKSKIESLLAYGTKRWQKLTSYLRLILCWFR